MAKIMKKNGQVLHRSIYQALTQDEWEQDILFHGIPTLEVWSTWWDERLNRNGCRGNIAVWYIWGQITEHWNISHFGGRTRGNPRVGNQYVNTKILLLRGNRMAKGCVGNLISRSNQNHILDTCLYEVEFPRDEITELTANIIAESMYAQCDVNRNWSQKEWFSSQCRGPKRNCQRGRNP